MLVSKNKTRLIDPGFIFSILTQKYQEWTLFQLGKQFLIQSNIIIIFGFFRQ